MLKYCLVILTVFPCMLFAQNTCTPVITITESKNNICLGTAITFHASLVNGGTNMLYKWKRNNADAGAGNNPDYTASDFKDGDIVTCEYTCKTTCSTDADVFSNQITVHVINDITPVIGVANEDPLICEGELTLFTAQASYGNAIPTYQWTVNGVPVGFNKPEYITDSLTNGARVECFLTLTVPGCASTPGTSHGQLTIYVYPLIHPAIQIKPTATDICRGETVTFTATANGGAYPSFAWEINGVPTGDVSASLTRSDLKDGDSISCTVTIDQDSRCHTTTSAPSNKVGMHVKDYIDPAVAIDAPLLDACQGDPLSFTATVQHPGDYISYSWLVNDRYTDGISATYTSNKLADGDKISCSITTSIPGCSFTGSASSNYKTVAIRDTPIITFTPADISIISGETAQLNASVTGSPASLTWRPAPLLLMPQSLTTNTIPINNDTLFNLVVMDVNGCHSDKALAVKVLYQMHIPSAFTPNKDGHNDVFRIPPGSSLILHELLIYDRWGNVIFRTTDIAKGWNGMYNGKNADVGTYIYVIKGTIQDKPVFAKGTVTLLR